MEAREFKLDIETKDPAQLSQEEQRLKAIKQILVGNQIERLENRFRGLSRRVESTNGHLVSTVDDLNQQISLLKAEMQLRDPNSEDTSKLQEGLRKLLEAQKGLNLEDPQICKQLEDRINTIENTVTNTQGMAGESQAKIQSMASDIQEFKDRLKNTQERLSQLDRGASPEQKARVNERLSKLEAKVQALNPKKIEARLHVRQNEFEDGVQDLVERLAGRVNERFEFAGKSRKQLFEKQAELEKGQKRIHENQVKVNEAQGELKNQVNAIHENQVKVNEEHHELKSRVNGIQDILENDIMSFLQKGGANGGPALEAHVKSLAADLERKITENNIRMEAKMEALMDMSSRQMMRQAAPQEDPKMKAIKDTLKTLSQLLDE
jgi:chromosome segregation ATPase